MHSTCWTINLSRCKNTSDNVQDYKKLELIIWVVTKETEAPGLHEIPLFIFARGLETNSEFLDTYHGIDQPKVQLQVP